MLQFETTGIAFAHLTLSPDAYADEVDALTGVLTGSSKGRVSFLTGQSDVMLQLELSDFRAAFDVKYVSRAIGANWLFAVPYKGTEVGAVGASTPALNYVIHLRLHRYVYGGGASAEENVVTRIHDLVAGAMTARVLAGFGWSDLIVTGQFADINALKNFVRALEREHVPETRLPFFRRLLTLISYERDTDFSSSTEFMVRPLIFGRALPSHVREAARAIVSPNVGKWRTLTVDGKWDLVSLPASPDGEISLATFIAFHKELATAGRAFSKFGIERLETHLLTHEVCENDATVPEDKPAETKSCACERFLSTSLENKLLIACERERILPEALSIAIRNVLNLFRSASRDSIDCCDITSSLRRCEIGLDRLLRHYRILNTRLQDAAKLDTQDENGRVSYWFNFVVKARQDIADWCTYAERIVSQRTVGRFEEFLAQTERVVSYRGGVQKMLYLTDALLNSYAKRALDDVDEPAFMSLFDPVDIVLAMRVVGFVRVPVRYLFSLPLTITHLWHEVGAYRFHAKYQQPHDTRTHRRLDEYMKHVEPGCNDTVGLMIDLADAYGDAVTLMYGFGGDVRRFFLSLATAQFEKSDFRLDNTPPSQRARDIVYLLTRLYGVLEFRATCEDIRRSLAKGPISEAQLHILDESLPPHDDFIDAGLRCVAQVLEEEVLIYDRYRHIKITAGLLAGAKKNIRDTFHTMFRAYLRELAVELAQRPVVKPPDVSHLLSAIRKGNVVDIDDASVLDQLFLELQREMIEHLRLIPASRDTTGGSEFFHSISALVRSSILYFYQQMENQPARREEKQPLAELWQDLAPSGRIPDLTLI